MSRLTTFATTAFLLTALAAPAMAQADQDSLIALMKTPGDWCYTQIYYDNKYGPHDDEKLADCPTEGICDDPVVRDSSLPDATDPFVTVRILFHVFAEDDGSEVAVDSADLALGVQAMNDHYAPFHIDFDYETVQHNNTDYRYLGSWAEFDAMHAAYAVDPQAQCNIYVVAVNIDGSVFSMGTFPWDPDADGTYGGILMNTTQMPPGNLSTMSHEMGHNLGLWHTFHGVAEVSQCGDCYEYPGWPNRDYKGDFCSDTDPTPVNRTCGPPGGEDPCTFAEWGETQPGNIMSYAPSYCRTEFSTHQGGRINCWMRDRLSGWIKTVDFDADTTYGEAPLNVNFTPDTDKDVMLWDWGFGDGGNSGLENPSHAYDSPGIYSVNLNVEATDGNFDRTRNQYIWVYADTLRVDHVQADPMESVRVDFYANNSFPLTELELPFTWAGELSLSYDSISTAGLRTEMVDDQGLVNFVPALQRAVYRFTAPPSNPIAPGSGPVLSVWFTASSGSHGDANAIELISFSSYSAGFTSVRGELTPVIENGSIELCRVADIDGSGSGPDVADLVYLVNYMFSGGPEPPHLGAADIDGNGVGPDIADLIYLINYMFNLGPAPVGCS